MEDSRENSSPPLSIKWSTSNILRCFDATINYLEPTIEANMAIPARSNKPHATDKVKRTKNFILQVWILIYLFTASTIKLQSQ